VKYIPITTLAAERFGRWQGDQFAKCAEAVGAFVSPECSSEFRAMLPAEIAAVLAKRDKAIRQLTERADAAERERDELRARLDEYERARTVATVVQAPGPYELRELQVKRCISHLNDSCFLPPIGTELIARPARKDGE
jgi:hypothetical protein